MIDLKKYVLKVDPEVEKMIESYNTYIEKISQVKLNDYINADKGFSIPKELSSEFVRFLDLVMVLFKKVRYKEVFNELIENEEENLFWNMIKELFEKRLHPYNESQFLRDMNISTFKEYVENIFQKYVLYNDRILEENGFSVYQVDVTVKMLNSAVDMVILHFKSEHSFKEIFNQVFELEIEKNNCIWDLIKANKTDLQYKMLINKINKNDKLLHEFMEVILDTNEEEE